MAIFPQKRSVWEGLLNIQQAGGLDGVNLSVEQGEFGAVVETSGSVIVHGDEPTIIRRRNIGIIFQNYNLVSILNVYENIVMPV